MKYQISIFILVLVLSFQSIAQTNALDSTITKMWDEDQQSWVNQSRIVHSYDANGIEAIRTISSWNLDESNWLFTNFSTLLFDNENSVFTDKLSHNWEGTDWGTAFKKDKFIYNMENMLDTSMVIHLDDEGNESPFQRRTFTYTSGQELVQSVFSQYYDGIQIWADLELREYSDYIDGNPQLKSFSTLDDQGNATLGSITEYEYLNEKLVATTWFTPDMTPIFLIDFDYDGNGDVLTRITKEWNVDTNEWENEYKIEYAYDEAYAYLDLNLPMDVPLENWLFPEGYDYYSLLFNHKLTTTNHFSWDELTSDWTSALQQSFYYSELSTSIHDWPESKSLLYPIPCTDYIYIDVSSECKQMTVQLFDTKGHLVLESNISGQGSIPVGKLSSGLYAYRLSCEMFTQNGTLIKH